jgi:putative component of membrane protein insertase Oxa1/YidC/SpoIIIJ protein YidD
MKTIWMFWLMIVLFLVSCAHLTIKEGEATPSFNLPKALLDFYQGPLNHCSAVRYGECPMYPSCSEYSKQAFEKYGFFIGAMIASDRLMRCGRDELKSAPLIFVEGKWKHYDPLEWNISWWDKK